MELKAYQTMVLKDLSRFMDLLQETKDISFSFTKFWQEHDRIPLKPKLGDVIQPYFNDVPNCPHVCTKVPTAGGKTLIASASLKVIFDHYSSDMKRAVVWLVPSDAILSQTLKNLKDSCHPYRQRINTDFSGKVEVYSKNELLNGTGLSPEILNNNLCIFVLSYDSLRTNNKEGRKVYQDNGHLMNLSPIVDEPASDCDVSAMNVLKSLNPVVIVDESHNAKSELSIKMLKELNPSFILDLTATPTKQSNIIAIVSALELKRANMVKLPVIVVNHENVGDVIDNAIGLQRNLEEKALVAYKNGKTGYIRPIVLFQAQPKTENDNITFRSLKELLVKHKIPEEQIKIKTANINELKNVDLFSDKCPVRFIITMNALKEGWDCSFAYILASITNRSSITDVTQILGRVLRLPYTTKQPSPELNMSYVLTSSNKFLETVDKITKDLNNAGFSDTDRRIVVQVDTAEPLTSGGNVQSPMLIPEEKTADDVIDELHNLFDDTTPEASFSPEENVSDIQSHATIPDSNGSVSVSDIIERAKTENEQMEKLIDNVDSGSHSGELATSSPEILDMVITAKIKKSFVDSVKSLLLPQFCTKETENDLFGIYEEDSLFDSDSLLEGFKLSKADTNIDFNTRDNRMYQVDVNSKSNGDKLDFAKVEKNNRNAIMNLMQNSSTHEQKAEVLISAIKAEIGNLAPISDFELAAYLRRIIYSLTAFEFDDVVENPYSSAAKIKEKIHQLSYEYKKKEFNDAVLTEKVELLPKWTFSKSKTLKEVGPAITKSLYDKEESFNAFERDVINDVANLENVEWWTRNVERRDFCINGFVNHYPDFIIKTKRGKIVLLETKGDHLDATDKIELGKIWADNAGKDYMYFLVYDKRDDIKGSYTRERFLKIMEDL